MIFELGRRVLYWIYSIPKCKYILEVGGAVQPWNRFRFRFFVSCVRAYNQEQSRRGTPRDVRRTSTHDWGVQGGPISHSKKDRRTRQHNRWQLHAVGPRARRSENITHRNCWIGHVDLRRSSLSLWIVRILCRVEPSVSERLLVCQE